MQHFTITRLSNLVLFPIYYPPILDYYFRAIVAIASYHIYLKLVRVKGEVGIKSIKGGVCKGRRIC
jgi:hypothetical protein